MKFSDYLFDSEDEEESLDLTSKLLLMDRALMEVHHKGYYISSSLLDAEIIDNKINPESISLDRFDPEKNDKDYYQDIMELAAIGICAYNRFGEYEGYPKYFIEPAFINGLIDNVEMYLTREDIPEEVKDYYRTIFTLLDFKYMTNYFEELKKGGKGNSRVYTYSTPEGRAFANNENNNAFTAIIAIPVILSIVYIVSIIIIFIAKNT